MRVACRALGRPARAVAAAGIGTLLASCAGLAPPQAAEGVSGKFSLQLESPRGREALSGRFLLSRQDDAVTIDLSTPLGTTLARLVNGPDGASVTVPQAGGLHTERGPDPEQLSERVLGWALPIAGIGDWIRGRPAAGRPWRPAAADGDDQIEQDGWTIRWSARAADGRVARLDLHRDARDGAPAVSLRVVLDPPPGS